MRKKIVAGNWKMNLSADEAKRLNKSTESQLMHPKCDVYQFVPMLYIPELISNKGYIQIGAQNGHPEKIGAYTGEISMNQLHNYGVQSVLIGHSERRHIFNETDVFIKEKIDSALANELTPFFCCGETLSDRDQDIHFDIVVNQIKNACFHLTEEAFSKLVIAYEPVWAIGTGKTASPEQANEMHRILREAIAQNYSTEIADNTTILYGGSCKPSNARDLFAQEHIDGGLIGGASLKADEFIQIVNSF